MIGMIYKLTDNSDKVYYGFTINPLKKRLSKHKGISNSCSSKMMDKDTMKIECLEQYYFDTDVDYKPFLKKREGYYIRNFECINKQIPDRTKKEYKEIHIINDKEKYEKNKEQILLQKKQYYEKIKEQISLKRKEKFTCECGSFIRKSDKTRHLKSKKHIAYNLSTISS
tara:strand:+ start:37 stop:543 length:507 start_codon:yes stop_codon:yes gene_type:complete